MILFTAPALSEDNSAEVYRDNRVYMGYTASGLDCGLLTYDSTIVESASGNITMTAKFDIPNNPEPSGDCTPDELVMTKGFPCNIIAVDEGAIEIHVSTTNTHFVATPGGKAVLKCKFKPLPEGYTVEPLPPGY